MTRMTRKARLSRGRRHGSAPWLLVIAFVLLAAVAVFDHNQPAFVGAMVIWVVICLAAASKDGRRRSR